MDINLASFLDSTLLKPEAGKAHIRSLCAEARDYGFHAVCINPCHLGFARSLLDSSPVRLCTVIGFPLGADTLESKLYAAGQCLDLGAAELDVVMNIGALKDRDWHALELEIASFIGLRDSVPFEFKYIVETALLDESELKMITDRLASMGADYIKTSTGFSTRGASIRDIEAIKEARGNRPLGIKASGGIRELDQGLLLIEAGATRLGTSNAAGLMRELEKRGNHGL